MPHQARSESEEFRKIYERGHDGKPRGPCAMPVTKQHARDWRGRWSKVWGINTKAA